MADRTVTVRLEAIVTPFQQGMAQAQHSVTQAATEMRGFAKVSQSVARDLQPLGTAMLGVGAAFAAGVGLSAKAAIDFEAAMRNVNSIMGQSEGQFAKTSDSVRALSRELPQSATNLAKGLYDIASSGFQGADGLEVLKASAMAATAGLSDTATASSAIVGALNAYGMSAAEAADVSDILFATVDKGVISFPELAQGLGEWVGTAHAAGVSLDEASAALATMTVNGVNAMEAGTSLNRVILSFIEPSDAMGDALHKIGFESGAAAIQALGLRGVMEKLADAGFNNVEALTKIFPEARALRGAFALVANDGAKFAQIAGEITDETERAGSTLAAFEEQSKSTAVQLQLLRNNLTDLAIEFGQALLPVIQIAVEVITDLLNGFRDMPGPMRALVAGLGVLTGLVTLLGGAFLFMLPRIQATQAALATLAVEAPAVAAGLRTITAATGAVGLALTVITAAYALFAANQDDAADSTNHMAEAFKAFSEGGTRVAARLVLEDLAASGILDTLNDLGVTTAAVTDILTTHQDGTERNVAAMQAWKAALDEAVSSGRLTQDEADALSQKVFKLGNDFSNAAGSGNEVDTAMQGLGDSFTGVGDNASDAEQRVKEFNDALEHLFGVAFSVEDAMDGVATDIVNLARAVEDARKANDANATSLDATTETGLKNREMWRHLTEGVGDVAKAMYEQGATSDQVAAAMQQQRDRLLEVASQLGFNTTEVGRYVDTLGFVPPALNGASGTITVTTDGAVANINNVTTAANNAARAISNMKGAAAAQAYGPGEFGSNALANTLLGPSVGLGGAAPLPVPTVIPTLSPSSGGSSSNETTPQEYMANRYAAGDISADAYKAYLEDLLSHTKRFSNEWIAIWNQIDQVNQDVGGGWKAAQDQIQSSIDLWMETLRRQHEVGDLSTADYLAQLQKRLDGLEKYSDEWMAIWREIEQLKDETGQDVIDIIQAVEKQRQFDQAFYATADQRGLQAARDTGTVVVQGGSSRTFSPSYVITTPDPASFQTNQRMRDDAFLAGV